jgi:glycosyltransferase involved in cell wall biosynthesis
VAEAMAVGTPVVAFRTGGIPEMIDHLDNGYIANYCDAVDLSDGIRYCLTYDLRTSAAAKAAQMYDEDRNARAYISLYNNRKD